MSFFALNLVLAIVWMLLTDSLSIVGLTTGFVLGFGAIAFSRRALGGDVYVEGLVALGRLAGRFAHALVRANLQLARDVLRPRPRFAPAFVRIELEGLGRGRTVLVGLLMSLTPGSLTIATDPRGRALWIHTLYAHDREAVIREVRAFADLVRLATGGGRPSRAAPRRQP